MLDTILMSIIRSSCTPFCIATMIHRRDNAFPINIHHDFKVEGEMIYGLITNTPTSERLWWTIIWYNQVLHIPSTEITMKSGNPSFSRVHIQKDDWIKQLFCRRTSKVRRKTFKILQHYNGEFFFKICVSTKIFEK